MNTDRISNIVHELLNTVFVPFGSSSDDWLHDPERMGRCSNAAEHGADGSTHAEVIQDQRDQLIPYLRRAPSPKSDRDRLANAAAAYLDEVETWHYQNGSLHHMIG